jgi:hypothetical protein
MFLSRNKLWAATHALLFDKFGDLRDGSTSLKPGVRVHSAVFPLARTKRPQRTAAALERPGCNRAPHSGAPEPVGTLEFGHGRRVAAGCASKWHTRHPRLLGRVSDRADSQAPEPGGGGRHQNPRGQRIRPRRRVRTALRIHGSLFPGACVLAACSAPDQALYWPGAGRRAGPANGIGNTELGHVVCVGGWRVHHGGGRLLRRGHAGGR